MPSRLSALGAVCPLCCLLARVFVSSWAGLQGSTRRTLLPVPCDYRARAPGHFLLFPFRARCAPATAGFPQLRRRRASSRRADMTRTRVRRTGALGGAPARAVLGSWEARRRCSAGPEVGAVPSTMSRGGEGRSPSWTPSVSPSHTAVGRQAGRVWVSCTQWQANELPWTQPRPVTDAEGRR